MWKYNLEELYTEEDIIYQLDILNVLKYMNSLRDSLDNIRTLRTITSYAHSLGLYLNISKVDWYHKINIGTYASGFQNYDTTTIDYNKVNRDIEYLKQELIAFDSRKIREDFDNTLSKLEKLDYKNV